MKKHIQKALKWALSKFEPDPAEVAAWPFPVPKPVSEDFDPRPKKKMTVPKATTRRPVAKKATKVAKKAK